MTPAERVLQKLHKYFEEQEELDQMSNAAALDDFMNGEDQSNPMAEPPTEPVTDWSAVGVGEAWDTDYETPESKKGMFQGRGVRELQKEYSSLKSRGPHKKGSAEFTKMRQVAFAIRAKKRKQWGKVS